ncbi:MAG: hypothetical protein JW871_06090 [Endomicrobiales bacterium]|nr:hypothetical protein [Endomicrobiales bacterium]
MNWRYLLLIPAIVFAIYIGKTLVAAPDMVIGIIGAIVIGLITFRKPEDGLLILVFSMLLSPEIKLAQVPKRAVVVRVDDLLLMAVFLAWLTRSTISKDWKGFVRTPLDKPLLLLFAIYVISTTIGIINGRIHPIKSFFYVLKYFEYFVLYWMAANIIESREHIKRYITAGFITSVIVVIYAYSLFGTELRIYAPFDTDVVTKTHGEPASLGGYLLIVMAISFGLFICQQKKWWLVIYFLALIPPLIKTLSRASFFSFLPMMAVIYLLAPRKKIFLFIFIMSSILLFPVLSPNMYKILVKRIQYTFRSQTTQKVGGYNIEVEKSTGARITNWKKCFNEWLPKHPFLGHGITGVGLVDSQYPLYLGEIGLFGFFTFLYIMLKIAAKTWFVMKNSEIPMEQGLALGLLGALTALLVQSIAINTFIIVRIMEPFWFLTAIVVGVIYPNLYKEETQLTAA